MTNVNRTYDLEKVVETRAFSSKLLGREADVDTAIRSAIGVDYEDDVTLIPAYVFGWNMGRSFGFEQLSSNPRNSVMAKAPVVLAPAGGFAESRSIRIQLNNFPYRSMVSCSDMFAQEVRKHLGGYVHGQDFWVDPKDRPNDAYTGGIPYLVNEPVIVRDGVEVRVYPSTMENQYFAVFTVFYTKR